MEPFPDLLRDRQTFRNVVVAPIELGAGERFRGGPVWPGYAFRFRARQLRGVLPIRRDGRPTSVAAPAAHLATATWCGPVVRHFGHAVADYGMRLAASARADPTQPLLFGIEPMAGQEPPGFFWEMLDHYGVARSRVVLLRETTVVRELHVFPQSERRRGAGPSWRHLDFLDAILPRPAPEEVEGAVYVSRSRLRGNRNFPAGEIAGEAYLETALARQGLRIVYPEELTLGRQLDLYRRARLLVFSEGSALHALQLLGRFDAEVVVIVRRRWNRIAAESLRPRARSLTYIHALQGMIHGLRPSGRPDRVRALAILEPDRLLDRLARTGLDLAPVWDEAAYTAQRDHDIAAWRAATLAQGFHPRSEAVIAKCLDRLSLRSGIAPFED